jgi:hypothetical protein
MQSTPHTGRHIPVGAIVALALIALVIVAGLVAIFWREWIVFSAAYPYVADVLRFVAFAAPISLGVGYAYTGLVILWRRYADHRYIQAAHVERLTLAQRSQGLPTTVQSLTYHDSHKELVSAPLALPPTSDTIVSIPTFAQLLDQGQIGPGRPLILGYHAATGRPLSGSWKDLYSCGVGAQQGTGKTWLLAFLLAQSAAAGGRLIICDLHAGDDESLANRIGALAPAFMMDIASTPKEIETAFAFADDKLEKRKGSTARWPIVIVADEWTSLLRTSVGANLPSHIQNIAEQGRKFNVNGMLAAQAWTKDASSAVRNQLTSHYVLRQRPDEARYQLGVRAANMPDDIRSLPDATAYLLNVKGELTKVIIPQMTAADIARAGAMIEVQASARPTFGFTAPTAPLTPMVASGTATGRQRDGNTVLPATASQTVRMASPEAARAAGLYIGGKSIAAIVEELRGVNSSTGGRAYRAAREEIEELIRQGVSS